MWFNDTPGYNLSVSHSIDLIETSAGSGIYEYESEAFFPIDGQLYGNNPGYGHNYGFTLELHGTFGYQPGSRSHSRETTTCSCSSTGCSRSIWAACTRVGPRCSISRRLT